MKRIPLTQGRFALVDDVDYEWLSKVKWQYHKSGYAVRNLSNRTLRMHRLIMDTPKGFETDHINRNRLDNRRTNLRICTRLQNAANHNKQSNNKSGFVGVSWHKGNGRWVAYITHMNKHITLGYFTTAEEASIVRDRTASKIRGNFAVLNKGVLA